jgi:plastocyanin domain-containing protein
MHHMTITRSTLGLLGALALLGGGAGCREASREDSPRPPASASAAQRIEIKATKHGFEPTEVHLEQGREAILVFTRVDETTCVEAVKMPWADRPTDLPLHQPVEIRVPDTSKAGTFTYACWMNMVYGRVVVDPS